MRSETLPSRAAQVATATMLMALVAIAATASAAPAPQSLTPAECRAAVMESHAVRAVAAAVAAVARDLLGGDLDGAPNAAIVSATTVLIVPPASAHSSVMEAVVSGTPSLTAATRAGLLDLPPPVC
ncbi:MAG TPA: hypothetical protein PK098_12765 [Phycisphaerales bacterium]|nr:hypothetical protein [Phycisphaerales bacterium]